MKKLSILCSLLLFLSFGCQKTSSQTWENVKTATRYLNKGLDSLMGKEMDSKMITAEDDFFGPDDDEFIPLSDEDLNTKFSIAEAPMMQKYETIGKKGSGIAATEKFQSPSGKLSSVFKKIHFNTDDHVIKEKQDLITIARVANFLKRNPNYYIISEGHCDQRQSSAYNMALGTRRANHIRVLLIKQGIDFNRIYTVSYGKEKPLANGSSREELKQNRRAEFKIYKK